jgi:preprotein translocase subunit SecE
VARDRKRAKQRQARRQSASAQRAPKQDNPAAAAAARDDDAIRDDDGLLDEGATPAPDPIEHASFAADVAEEQVEAGAPLEPELDDGRPGKVYRDEVEDAIGAAPRGTHDRPKGFGRFLNFLRGSWAELQRVQWPTRSQVAQATGVVIGFVIVAGTYLGLLDVVWRRVVDAII